MQQEESAVVASGAKDFRFAAPEEFSETLKSSGSRATDVYSFGVLLWSMA